MVESLYGLNHNGTEYLYVLNLQGDVVALTDTSGAVVVSYTYDAWGNVTGTSGRLAGTLGSLNPMRYRSYYFDTETGYYYLQSRYYDAGWGRFINADEPELLPTIQVIDSSMNLFVYCNNNPVHYTDPTGELPGVTGAIIGAVFAAVMYRLEYLLGMRKWRWSHFIGHVALAAAVGAAGAHFRYLAKVGKLAKLAKRIKISNGALKFVINIATRAGGFIINGISKRFTRKKGENWPKTIKRWFGW